MKLKTYLLIGFLTVFTTAFSQSRLVYVNDLGDDWRIGLAAGIQKFAGTPSGSVSFTETLSPALELHLSKWLTPAYGLRIGYKGASFSNTYGKSVSFFTLHGECMFNVQNMFDENNTDRFWNCSPYIGTGWAASRGENKNDGWALHWGVFNTFRVTSYLSASVEFSSFLADKEFDLRISGDEGFDKMFALTLGLIYRLNLSE
ncbi:MAG: hypothetical protein MJZ28_02780 [Paludibacteraceae bacterium]|nr:hypothetical protein [Paludibacteraceae bacterium]